MPMAPKPKTIRGRAAGTGTTVAPRADMKEKSDPLALPDVLVSSEPESSSVLKVPNRSSPEMRQTPSSGDFA